MNNLKDRVDRSLKQGGVWERATFTIPDEIPQERAEFHFDKYIKRAAEAFENMGYQVLEYTWPIVSLGKLPTDKDRRRYDIWFWCRKKPHTIKLEIPEERIPAMLEKGLKLV